MAFFRQSIFAISSFLILISIWPNKLMAQEVSYEWNGPILRLGLNVEATALEICFLANGDCMNADALNPYVFEVSVKSDEVANSAFVAIVETNATKVPITIAGDASGEWSRGAYVIIGALIGLISTFGLRLIEISSASIFRRRRAVARLRANLLRVQENLVTEQPIAFSDVVLNMTSFGQVHLRSQILEVQEILAKHKVSNLSTAEAAAYLEAVDASLDK